MVISQMNKTDELADNYCHSCLSENAAEIIGAEGGIQDILAAMRAFPKELELVSNCCIALWSLSVAGTYSYIAAF